MNRAYAVLTCNVLAYMVGNVIIGDEDHNGGGRRIRTLARPEQAENTC